MMPLPEDHHSHDPIEAALRDRVAAPDQTRAIMGRLGYMRVGASIARRQRRMARMRQAACLLLMAAAVGVGYTWYQSAGDIRRVDDVTLPGAFAGQMEQRGAILTGLLESIRPLESFDVEPVEAANPAEEDRNRPQPIVPEPVEQDDTGDWPMIDLPDDEAPANVAIAPFRWT